MLVAARVRDERAVAGVLHDDQVSLAGAADECFDLLAHPAAGGRPVKKRPDLEATRLESRAPVARVVVASCEVVLGARVIVDADAQGFLGHGENLRPGKLRRPRRMRGRAGRLRVENEPRRPRFEARTPPALYFPAGADGSGVLE
jgi:hypothetical protein